MPAETYKEKLQETFPQGSVVEIIDPDNQLIMATILDYTDGDFLRLLGCR